MTQDTYVPQYDGPVTNPDEFVAKMANVVGQNESGNRYLPRPNAWGAMGRYQFTRGRLNDLGYGDTSNEDFINNPRLQDQAFRHHVDDILSNLAGRGYVNQDTPQSTVAGLVMAAHLGGMGGVNSLINGQGGQVKDGLGTSIQDYFQRGQAAFSGVNSGSLNTSYRNKIANQPLANLDTSNPSDLFAPTNIVNKAMAEGGLNIPDDMVPADHPIPGMFDGLTDTFSNAYTSSFSQQNTGIENQLRDQVKGYEQLLQDKFNIQNPGLFGYSGNPITDMFRIPGISASNTDKLEAFFNQRMQELQQQNPDVNFPIKNFDGIYKEAGKKIRQLSAEANEAYAKAGSVGGTLGNLAGSMVGWLRDPLNLGLITALSPVAGPSIAGQAGAMAGLESLEQLGGKQGVRSRLGLENGPLEAGKEIAESAAGGAVGAGIGKLFGAVLRKLGIFGETPSGKQGQTWQEVGKDLQDTKTPEGIAIGAKAENAGQILEQNPLPDVTQLDNALEYTMKNIQRDKPIDTANLLANQLEYKQLAPVSPDSITALIGKDIPELKDLELNANTLQNQASEQLRLNPQDFVNQDSTLGRKSKDLLPDINEAPKEVSGAKEVNTNPLSNSIDDMISRIADDEGIDLTADPEARDRIMSDYKVPYEDSETGTVEMKSLKEIQENSEENHKLINELQDCIGRNS